jgi:hypothetical protein
LGISLHVAVFIVVSPIALPYLGYPSDIRYTLGFCP